MHLSPEMAKQRVFSVVTVWSNSKLSNHSHIWSSGYWLLNIHTPSSWTVKQLLLKFCCANAPFFQSVGLERAFYIIAMQPLVREERKKRNHSEDI